REGAGPQCRAGALLCAGTSAVLARPARPRPLFPATPARRSASVCDRHAPRQENEGPRAIPAGRNRGDRPASQTGAVAPLWLDAHMARRWEQQSEIGRFLDPIADKLLVSATLFMLTAFGRLSAEALLPALVILCREILVSGLREYLAGLRVGMPVSRLAKWKTVIQMVAIGVLIVGDAGPGFVPVTAIGETLLWIAAILTLVTGYDYLRAGLRHMARPRAGRANRKSEHLA